MFYGNDVFNPVGFEISDSELYNAIKTGYAGQLNFGRQIARIRQSNKKDRTNMKKKLPFFSTACFNPERCLNKNVEYIEDVILDFDNIRNVKKTKEMLARDKYVKAVFVSSSGKGLKAIVSLHDKIYNQFYYKQLWVQHAKYFINRYDLEPDAAKKEFRCKSYLTKDKNIVVKENVRLPFYAEKPRPKYKKVPIDNFEVNCILAHLTNYKISYNDWLTMGFALANMENGEEMFVQFGMINENYQDNEMFLRNKFRSFKSAVDNNPEAVLYSMARRYGYSR